MLANCRNLVLVVLSMLTLAAMPAAVSAQVVIDPPFHPAPPIAWVEGISVDEHHVAAQINGPIAEVTVTQVFRNDSHGLAEGVFLFPLPEDAAVGDFQMTVNGQVIEGQLMDGDAARGIYEETVRQIRDPALLEYAGRGLYRTSVFPIPPGESRTLQLRYGVLLESENGLTRFDYPLRIPGASRPANQTTLQIDIRSEGGLRAVYSPTHDVVVERSDDAHAVVRFESTDLALGSDFELYFGLGDDAIGLNLLSYKPAGEDGYFLLIATPSIEAPADGVAARDVVFVLDVSGSMEGPKIGQAKDAVRYVVEHLNPGDRFNLIAFSTGVRLWNEQLVEASAENVVDASEWIDGLSASGSTDINRALLESLAQLSSGGSAADTGYVLFMTDGLPTQGETETHKIIRNALNNQPLESKTRLFTFGVGFDVNTDLLDTVSRELGGRSRYVLPDEQIDEAVSQFYATIQTPVLTDVAIDFGEGPVVSDTYPNNIPDLFAGEQTTLLGRYRHGGDVSVTLSGQVDGQRVKYVYAERSLVNAGGEPFVGRLWATRKIGELMRQIRVTGPDPELVDAIVDLSLEFGIVTPYTSYLVEEPEPTRFATDDMGDIRAMPLADFTERAQSAVTEQAAAAAEAPASGESAVLASGAREKLASAVTVDEHSEVRFAGGRTFVSQGEVMASDGGQETLWVDTAYRDGMTVETVAFASDRFFELAAEDDIAQILALSQEVLFVLDEEAAIRVTLDESLLEQLESSDGDRRTGDEDVADTPSDSLWQQFWQWLDEGLLK